MMAIDYFLSFTANRLYIFKLVLVIYLLAMIAHGKHHSPGNRKRPQLGPSKSFASVHIDNSTSLDPYKDGQNLFKRQIIILLLPNYFNRKFA